MNRELWRKIDGFPNYMVSNLGRVKSIHRVDNLNRTKPGKILKPWKVSEKRDGSNCLLGVSLYNYDNEQKKVLVQRLVAEAFLGRKTNQVVTHINENRHDCRAQSLKWITESERNINKKIKKGKE